jgi:hypothetical protein
VDPQTGVRELYNVAEDPRETNDLADPNQRQVLGRVLDAWVSEADPLPSEKVRAPDITEQLEALGYVE